MLVFIDTELWVFAQKVPDPKLFQDDSKYNQIFQCHKIADEFLSKIIQENEIAMTHHQLCEIFHILGFRGRRLPKEFVLTYCSTLLKAKFMHWYSISESHIRNAIQYSISSGIHIWDYLCVLPLYNDVDILYTCDQHFKDSSFQSFGVPIENPLKIWLLL